MKITYDPQVDALYIHLRYVQAVDSIDIEAGVTADLDSDGHIIGLEILGASKKLGGEPGRSVKIEHLLPTP